MAYPLTIAGAVKQAYAPKHVKITTTCKKTFGRHLYALVAVSLPNGKASTLALQFINTAGWFACGGTTRCSPRCQGVSVRLSAPTRKAPVECA